MFAPLGREYEFVPADTFDNEEVKKMIENGLNTEEGGNVFNNKTREMKRLCYLYRHDEKVKIDHRADAYVFLLDKNTNAAVKGYMPRTNSEGFVFVGGADMDKERVSETLIHELCHGLYGLQHTFDYGVAEDAPSDNIMSYSKDTGRRPSKYFQWYNVENPSDYHLPFTDSAEDGETGVFYNWFWFPNDNFFKTDKQSKVSENLDAFIAIIKDKNIKDKKWKVTEYKDSPDVWHNIMDKENVSVEDFKANNVYVWNGNVELETKKVDGEKNIYTLVNFFSFKDSPKLSDYKVNTFEELEGNERVVAGYYENDVTNKKFGFISFYSENGDLEMIMQVLSPELKEGDTKDVQKITESWVRSLLVRESGDGEEDEVMEKEEEEKSFEQRISDALEYMASFTGHIVNENGVREPKTKYSQDIFNDAKSKKDFLEKAEDKTLKDKKDLTTFLKTSEEPDAIKWMDCTEFMARFVSKVHNITPAIRLNTNSLCSYTEKKDCYKEEHSGKDLFCFVEGSEENDFNDIRPGDIFIWGYNEEVDCFDKKEKITKKCKKWKGHVGVVESYNEKDDLVTILESVQESSNQKHSEGLPDFCKNCVRRSIYNRYLPKYAALAGHKGWRGYFRLVEK